MCLRMHEYSIKVMGTWSWIKLVCHKLGCMKFPTNMLPDFTITSHYRGHLALVRHNTNFATVHSWVTVSGCLVEYEYKLLRQLACFIVHRMLYTSVFSICMTLVQGHTKHFWNKNFPVRHSLFAKLVGTHFRSIHCHSVLFRDMSKNTSCGPAVSYSGSVKAINST